MAANPPGIGGPKPTGANANKLRDQPKLWWDFLGIFESDYPFYNFLLRCSRNGLCEGGIEIEFGEFAVGHERLVDSADLRARPALSMGCATRVAAIAATLAGKHTGLFF
jgi:hypothetical protein